MGRQVVAALMGMLFSFALVCAALPARADDTADEGRKIAEQWQQTVVTLEIVSKLKVTAYGEENTEEKKIESTGVVIDPSGLIVTALTPVDPSALIADMMEGADSEDSEGTMQANVEITSLKIMLQDGKELDGQIVLRDKDLDLAFIRPLKAPEQPLTSIAMNDAIAPQLFDKLFVLDRLGISGNRAIAVTQYRVNSIVVKPRTFYVLLGSESVGTPVFAANGKAVGILTLRRPPKGAKESSDMSGSDWLIIAVPMADIQEVAKQAPQVEEKK